MKLKKLITINNGVLDEYRYLFEEIGEDAITQVPILLDELNKRFKNKLTYKISVKNELKKMYMLSVTGYRKVDGRYGKMLEYRTQGNFIFDGKNILEDGVFKNLLANSGKIDDIDHIELTPYKKILRILNRADLKMYVDDPRKEQLTPEQYDQLCDVLSKDKRPVIDMLDRYTFDIEVEIIL